MKKLYWLLLFSIGPILLAQQPQATPENTVKVTEQEKADILQAQRDLSDAQVTAYQISGQLASANDKIKEQLQVLNEKVDALRTKYKLSKEAFFNAKEVIFIKPPTKEEKK